MAKKKDLTGLKEKLIRWHDASVDARKNIDWRWFIQDLFVDGKQYTKWDKDTQQIVPVRTTEPKIVINKIYTTLRVVRNYAVRNKPRAEVVPENATPETIDEALGVNKYLDYIFEKLSLNKKLKGTVWNALIKVGYWQIVWNEAKQEIDVNEIDPYDLFWDPIARNKEEARFVFLDVARTKEALRESGLYDEKKIDELKTDKNRATSSVKNRLLQLRDGDYIGGETSETVIVKECWYKENGKVWLATLANDEWLREPEETEYKELPFYILNADTISLQMFGNGWVRHMIDPQKLLNRTVAHIDEWNRLMNKGKYVADKGAGVRIINDQNGQIIEKKRGFDVHQQPVSPLAAAIFQQEANANRYIEDLGAAHDALAGRVPTAAKSGRAIEALQTGDVMQLTDLTDNIDDFLEDAYEAILWLASKKYQFARNIVVSAKSGEKEFVKVIGQGAKNVPENTTVIQAKNHVDVTISSWLANTPEARREILKELYQLQAIDQQTLLEGYEIGPVADVLKRSRDEQMRNAAMEMAQKQGQQQEAPQAGAAQAIPAIRQIIQTGQMPQPPQQVSPEYIQYIDQFLSSPEAQRLDPTAKAAIQRYRDAIAQQA